MRLRHYMGIDVERWRRDENAPVPVVYDTDLTLNSHALFCGMSGTGKSFQCKQFLGAAARAGLEIDIFDVHEELHDIPGAVCCKYSQSTKLGFNPLVLDTDVHTGGVVAKANEVIELLGEVAHLGIKQQSCLRALIYDTFAAAGIFQNDPSTWRRRQITEREHEDIVARRAYAELRNYYPTLTDLQSYARRKLQMLALGGNEMSTAAFEDLNKCLKAMNRANSAWGKATTPEEKLKIEQNVEQAKQKYNEATMAWCAALTTGRELEDILRYDSADVLKGLMDRIEELNSAGIFRANKPPFGNAKIRVHQIKALSNEEQRLFVRMRLRETYDRYKKMGSSESGVDVRHIVFLDEGHKFFNANDDDIVNVIAREARKFGIGLWAASQSPADFPKSFLSNVGLTVLLGIHPMWWGATIKMLGAKENVLQSIKAKETMAVRLQLAGESNPPFTQIAVPNVNTITNRMCKIAVGLGRKFAAAA